MITVWTALESTYEKQTALTGEGSDAVAKGVLAMIFLYNLAFAIGWGPLQVTYVVEILPYHLRARVGPQIDDPEDDTDIHQGLVLYNLFVALALIFNQYANPVGVTNIKWKCKFLHSLLMVFLLMSWRLHRVRYLAFRRAHRRVFPVRGDKWCFT